MPDNQQIYQRGRTAALIGLAVQLFLSIAMALIGLWSDSAALHATTFHLLGGLPIWALLWMLYHQHSLERIEALEAEQLAQSDAQTAAIFDEHAQDLQIARRRLGHLYKWGLSGVSFVLAIYLIVLGAVWLYLNRLPMAGGQQVASPLALVALCLAVTFIAFIVARYVAGMTRIKAWQLLRGGASYLMGSAVIAALAAFVGFLQWLEVPRAFEAFGLIVPLIMLLIGVEIIITFLLSAYRPRKPGEIPRPAFDSRVLGLLTSPESIAKAVSDTINYQFGFEISRSWFYKLLADAITPLLVFGLLSLIAISSIVVVDPHEQAIVTRFGAIVGEPVEPGLTLKLPWPISRAAKYPVGRIHQVSVGSVRTAIDKSKAILWTTEHTTGEEQYLITGATPLAKQIGHSFEDEAAPGSHRRGPKAPGMALVAADVIVQFRVRDLVQFVRHSTDPSLLIVAMRQSEQWAILSADWEQGARRGPDPLAYLIPVDPCPMLTAIAGRRVNTFFAQRDIDYLLTAGRISAGRQLRHQIQQDVDRHRLGLDVVFVGLAGIHPPSKSDVAAAFHEQIGALQERQSVVEKARGEAIGMLAKTAGSQQQAQRIYTEIEKWDTLAPDQRDAQEKKINHLLTESRGEAAEQIYNALAYRWSRMITERAKAHRFGAQLGAYRMAPQYYKARLYFQVLADGRNPARKIIIPSRAQLRIDAKDTEANISSLFDK